MTDSTEMDICESLTQWVEVIRAPNNAWLTLVDIALIDGECVSVDMEKAIVEITKLRAERDAAARDTERLREALEYAASDCYLDEVEGYLPTPVAVKARAALEGQSVIATEGKSHD